MATCTVQDEPLVDCVNSIDTSSTYFLTGVVCVPVILVALVKVLIYENRKIKAQLQQKEFSYSIATLFGAATYC